MFRVLNLKHLFWYGLKWGRSFKCELPGLYCTNLLSRESYLVTMMIQFGSHFRQKLLLNLRIFCNMALNSLHYLKHKNEAKRKSYFQRLNGMPCVLSGFRIIPLQFPLTAYKGSQRDLCSFSSHHFWPSQKTISKLPVNSISRHKCKMANGTM